MASMQDYLVTPPVPMPVLGDTANLRAGSIVASHQGDLYCLWAETQSGYYYGPYLARWNGSSWDNVGPTGGLEVSPGIDYFDASFSYMSSPLNITPVYGARSCKLGDAAMYSDGSSLFIAYTANHQTSYAYYNTQPISPYWLGNIATDEPTVRVWRYDGDFHDIGSLHGGISLHAGLDVAAMGPVNLGVTVGSGTCYVARATSGVTQTWVAGVSGSNEVLLVPPRTAHFYIAESGDDANAEDIGIGYLPVPATDAALEHWIPAYAFAGSDSSRACYFSYDTAKFGIGPGPYERTIKVWGAGGYAGELGIDENLGTDPIWWDHRSVNLKFASPSAISRKDSHGWRYLYCDVRSNTTGLTSFQVNNETGFARILKVRGLEVDQFDPTPEDFYPWYAQPGLLEDQIAGDLMRFIEHDYKWIAYQLVNGSDIRDPMHEGDMPQAIALRQSLYVGVWGVVYNQADFYDFGVRFGNAINQLDDYPDFIIVDAEECLRFTAPGGARAIIQGLEDSDASWYGPVWLSSLGLHEGVDVQSFLDTDGGVMPQAYYNDYSTLSPAACVGNWKAMGVPDNRINVTIGTYTGIENGKVSGTQWSDLLDAADIKTNWNIFLASSTSDDQLDGLAPHECWSQTPAAIGTWPFGSGEGGTSLIYEETPHTATLHNDDGIGRNLWVSTYDHLNGQRIHQLDRQCILHRWDRHGAGTDTSVSNITLIDNNIYTTRSTSILTPLRWPICRSCLDCFPDLPGEPGDAGGCHIWQVFGGRE